MKRRPQSQEADLFSYAASQPSAVEEQQPLSPPPVAPLSAQEPLATEQSKAEPEPIPVPASGFDRARFARSVVVSIHDVSPGHREATERIMAELREAGIIRFVLLVVPNHHCQEYFLDHPEFCQWLRDLENEGHEIVVHGYHHRRDQRPGETFRQKLATQYYTAGEGEFYDITGADALRVISQARQEFRKIGLKPKGFVAPAWLLSDGADRALQRLGVCYTTRLGGLFDYTTGTQHHSQSLVWSTRSAWRRAMSLLWNAYLFRKLSTTQLLRISVHPADVRHPAVWRQIKALAAKALKDRVPTTFTAYLNLK